MGTWSPYYGYDYLWIIPSYVNYSAIAGRVTRSALKPAAQESAAKRAIASVRFQRLVITHLIVDIVINIHIIIKTSLCLESTPPVVWQKLCCTEISVFPKGGRTANQLVWRDRSKNFGDAAADGSQCHVVQNKLPNLFAVSPFTASVQFRLQVQCFKILHPPRLWLGLIRISCSFLKGDQ